MGGLSLIGFLDAVRGTPIKKVLPMGRADLPRVEDPEFRTIMELVSRTSMCEGHSVEVFWNGDQTYPRLWADLRDAGEVDHDSAVLLQLRSDGR